MPPIPSATTAAASGRAHLPDGARDGLIARYQDKHSPDQIRCRLALLRAGQISHTILLPHHPATGLALSYARPHAGESL